MEEISNFNAEIRKRVHEYRSSKHKKHKKLTSSSETTKLWNLFAIPRKTLAETKFLLNQVEIVSKIKHKWPVSVLCYYKLFAEI